GNGQVIGLYEITPMTVRLAAAGIELPVLDLIPGPDDLFGDGGRVFRIDQDLYFTVFLFLIRLYKIKLRTGNLPILLLITIHQKLIKNGLAPIVPAVRVFLARRRQLFSGLVR